MHVAKIADAVNERLDPRIAQPAGITDCEALRPPVAVMDQGLLRLLRACSACSKALLGQIKKGYSMSILMFLLHTTSAQDLLV